MYIVQTKQGRAGPPHLIKNRLPRLPDGCRLCWRFSSSIGPAVCLFSLSPFYFYFFNQEMLPNPFVSLIFLWLPISSISNQTSPLAQSDGPRHPLTSLNFAGAKGEKKKRSISLFHIYQSQRLYWKPICIYPPPLLFSSLL